MRSLMSFGLGRETEISTGASSTRPEILRRKTIATNARITIAASAIGMPVAIYLLIQGALMPFVAAIMALAAGIVSMAMHGRGEYELAARTEVVAIAAIGLVLAVADPNLIDFGVAAALLAPVHATLLTRGTFKRWSWVLAVGVAVLAIVVPWPDAHRNETVLVSGAIFAVIAFIVASSANRLDAAFAVYDKAQVTAYKHLIEHVQDGVMRFSTSGEALFVSRSTETLFGCKRFELTASGIIERLHVLDRPAYMTAFAAANQDGKASKIEVRMRRDDEDASHRLPQFIWVEAGLSPVIDPEARAERHEVVALLRDITERRDHDNEMRAARKAAEDASNAKSRFLAVIGHELRTPLNAIVGFSEMMTSNIGGELSPTHREYAGHIHQSGHHLLDVVGMLLDMSRIEAGKFELQAESFAPETLIEPCLRMVDTMAKTRGIHIVVDIARNLPQVVADERACRQMLINLLSNAIKFSHEGGTITVTLKRQGQNLSISVADQGIGMAQDSVARIGEPFFQAQDTLARRYEGTGLGLSIVKGLVDLHSGWLRAVSEPGLGTNMTVFLPINGPAIKLSDTATVTPLTPPSREPASQHQTSWQDVRRKAQ